MDAASPYSSALTLLSCCFVLSACFSTGQGASRSASSLSAFQSKDDLSSYPSSIPESPSQDRTATARASVTDLMRKARESNRLSRESKRRDSASAARDALHREMKVTIDVRELPLSDLLTALAEESGIDIIAAKLLNQPVTLRLKNQSLATALDTLAAQFQAVWQFDDNAIHFFADKPVVATYPVNYLNIARETTSSVGLATRVGSFSLATDQQQQSSTEANNSQTRIDNLSHHDFWESLKIDLDSIASVSDDTDFKILVNREAALVTVIAKQALQRTIRDYLQALEKSVARQVLIEATVVEVSLSDEHRTGVDWRIFNSRSDGSQSNGFAGLQNLHGNQIPSSSGAPQTLPSALLQFRHRSSILGDLTASIELLQSFGDVHILSQPQIIAMNNQSAVLKVVDNRVYFSVKVNRSGAIDSERVSTETRIHTVPVGLVMSVIPFISADERVVLNIRPSISRILGFREDPIPTPGVNGIRNSVPEIQVREMESVLSVRDGETVVIGGLMQQNANTTDSGLRGLRSVPWLGKLFGRSTRASNKSELLVFLRPTVLDNPS